MERFVRFLPEFVEAIADGINMIGIFGAVSVKTVGVEITIDETVVCYTIQVTPELIMELMPFHSKAQNQQLTEEDEFMLVANAPGLVEQLLILNHTEIGMLCLVADKIIGGARGELVPDLQGEIEVVSNEKPVDPEGV